MSRIFKHHLYPQGSTVDAYKWEDADVFVRAGQVPPCSKIESPTTATDSTTTFSSLVAGKLYWLHSQVGGQNRYTLVQG